MKIDKLQSLNHSIEHSMSISKGEYEKYERDKKWSEEIFSINHGIGDYADYICNNNVVCRSKI